MIQTVRITVIFEPDWVETHPFAIAHLRMCLQDSLMSVQVIKESPKVCVFEALSSDVDDADYALNDALDEIGAQGHFKLAQVKLAKKANKAQVSTPKKAKKKKPKLPKNSLTIDTQVELQSLVGAESFQALLQELVDLAPHIKASKTWGILSQRCYLFSIEEGYGFTTQLRLLGKVLGDLGFCDYNDAPTEFPGDMPLDELLRGVRNTSSQEVIGFDLSPWVGKENDPHFRLFLRKLQKMQSSRVFVFRTPFADKDACQRLCDAVAEIFTLVSIDTPPLSMAQLREFAEETCDKEGFSLGQEAWNSMEQHLLAEKSKGRFWGLRTVQKVIVAFLYEKLRHNVTNDDQDDWAYLGSESVPWPTALTSDD